MSKRVLPPVHPGDVLLEDVMKPWEMTVGDLAEALNVDPRLIAQVISGKARVTANLALRLARYLKMTPGFWLRLQADYDLEIAEERRAEEIERTVKVREDMGATA
ncbi:MAG: HigA family addiction module antitoxin [Pseudomonadota bacterium]